jgi:hypothetical protein
MGIVFSYWYSPDSLGGLTTGHVNSDYNKMMEAKYLPNPLGQLTTGHINSNYNEMMKAKYLPRKRKLPSKNIWKGKK